MLIQNSKGHKKYSCNRIQKKERVKKKKNTPHVILERKNKNFYNQQLTSPETKERIRKCHFLVSQFP